MSIIVQPDPALLAVVQKAWMQALRTERCDFTQSWAEAGGDSLATLHLMLRLERALGRKLLFDIMQPQMRASDLAALLPQGLASQPASLPLVHLVPSMFGDEPRLAEFRQAVAGRISFNVVATPDASQPQRFLGICCAWRRLRFATSKRGSPQGLSSWPVSASVAASHSKQRRHWSTRVAM